MSCEWYPKGHDSPLVHGFQRSGKAPWLLVSKGSQVTLRAIQRHTLAASKPRRVGHGVKGSTKAPLRDQIEDLPGFCLTKTHLATRNLAQISIIPEKLQVLSQTPPLAPAHASQTTPAHDPKMTLSTCCDHISKQTAL